MSGVLQTLVGSMGMRYINIPATLVASHIGQSPTNGYAEIEFRSDGTIYKQENATNTQLGTWLVAGANSDYEVRMTGTGDSPGTLNTWEALSTTRTWSLSQNIVGSKVFNGTVEIRKVSTGVVEDSGTVQITAEKEP